MKQYTRIYRNSSGKITHAHTQTTPIDFEPIESDSGELIESEDFVIEDEDESEEKAAAIAAFKSKNKEEFVSHKKRYQEIRANRFVKAREVIDNIEVLSGKIKLKDKAKGKIANGKRLRMLTNEEDLKTVKGKINNPDSVIG